MNHIFNCKFVPANSGGIQEETTHLGIPCLTLRSNAERPITIHQGTTELCTIETLQDHIAEMRSGKQKQYSIPEVWHGTIADRIIESIQKRLCKEGIVMILKVAIHGKSIICSTIYNTKII